MSRNKFARLENINPAPLVLIVEDDADSRLMLKYLLELWGYRVLEASDGHEAVNLVGEKRPDLILMDVKLPCLDGFDTTRRIREVKETGGIPIIFVSACAEKLYRSQALDAGGNDYLVKPIDFQQLEYTLKKYVRKPESEFSHQTRLRETAG